MLYTLTMVAVLSGSPLVTHHEAPNKAACAKRLALSIEGARLTFNENVVGAAKIEKAQEVDGWAVLRTPMGRTVARMRCEPQQ